MKDRIHIAEFTNTYKPNVNGVVRSVSTFRDAFTRMGHNCFIFAQDARGYEDEEPFVYRYPAIKIPTVDYSAALPVSHFVNTLFPTLKVDVIHSNHFNVVGDAAASKAKDYDLPLVFTFHTRYDEYSHYVPFSQNWVREIIERYVARYMRQCQHVVTPSDSIKQMLSDEGITDRVTTIPTGIDIEPFHQADGSAIRAGYGWDNNRVLVSVGRLASEKNWDTLIDAFVEVYRNRDDVRMIIVGEGPDRKDYEHRVKKEGLDGKIVFAGLQPFEEVPNYLKAADLFCFASVTETQGLVTMEAMAADLPIVAVDATGTGDEVDNNVEGLLTEDDPHALAQAILSVLADDGLYQRLKEGAKAKAKSFDLMAQAGKMLDVFAQASDDKKAGRTVQVPRDFGS